MTFVLRYFPRDLLKPAQLSWALQGALVGSGATASGAMPTTNLSGGGLWKASFGAVPLYNGNKRRTWDALQALLDNGATPIVLPMIKTIDQNWPVVAGAPLTGFDQVPHSDDALFSDGSGYESGIIEIASVGAAALRATAMTVRLVAGSALLGGERFSIDHPELRWRLYQIATASDNGNGTFAVTIRPPLRAAVPDATWLEFDHPKCVMRLAKPEAMDASFRSPFIGEGSPDWVEAFPPFPS